MADTPSWLKPGNDAPAPAATSLDVSAPTASGYEAGVSAEDEKDLPSIILMMRLTNMGMAAGLITVSVSQ